MPSVAVSRHWFTQVDGPREFCEQKLKLLGVELETAIAVYHTGEKGDNPHFHMVSTMSKEIQKQSWDVKIKKMFGVSGSQFSSKVWDANLDSEGAGSYLFHEDPDNAPILLEKNVPAEKIQNLKDIAKVVNKVVAVNREKSSTKIADKVMEKWASSTSPGKEGIPQWGNHEIVECICRMAKNGECYLPKTDWLWKAYIEEIKLRQVETPAQFDSFVYRTFDRLFSRG